MHRCFVRTVALGTILLLSSSGVFAAEALRPNIIYIMPDDLGYGDLGSYGQKVVKTPHIDLLAAEGMRLTDYYAGNTVCRPSRLVLWLGKHAAHTPISSNAPYTMQSSDVTVAQLLKQAGYATGGIGKWACGEPGTGGEPIYHGFDSWFGYLNQSNAHNYYPTHLWDCSQGHARRVDLPGNVLLEGKQARGRVADPAHRQTYSHDVMTEHAFQFIRENHQQPFLLHMHWTIPHTNNEGGRVTGDGQEVPDYGQYSNQDWPNPEKGFAAMVSRMDRDIGRLTTLLRELKIDKKTLIIFTSDNGPHQEGGHKMEFFNSNGPLRGYKRDLYEGGIRVPTIAWWPGTIAAGTSSAEPLCFYDFLPTACELAGAEIPPDTDGISFVPTLLQQSQKSHDYLVFKYGKKVSAIRQGQWKLVKFADRAELFDLKSDIGEQQNIAKREPDRVRRMEAILRAESN